MNSTSITLTFFLTGNHEYNGRLLCDMLINKDDCYSIIIARK